jgi:hypothetical protein
MARGMVVGEKIVSQASTDAFREGHARTFGEPTPGSKGGRWIYDAQQQKLVRADEYVPPSRAIDGTVITDRWYEGARTLDGEDIGSRRKRAEYMKRKGYVDGNDVTPAYVERVRAEAAREAKRERRGAIEESYRRHRATPTVERLAPRGVYED